MRPDRVLAAQFFAGEPPVLHWPAMLAEGDSWFTLGELNFPAATNLMLQLDLPRRSTVVDSAYPGDTLQNMVDGINDTHFDRLLRHPRFALSWSAILLSAGGNDLIDALGVPVYAADGSRNPMSSRLLLAPDEFATVHPGESGPLRWVSEDGWGTLAAFLRHNLRVLVERRDSGPAASRPLVLHTYSMPTVWACGTIGAPEGWLYPAMNRAGVPEQERQDLCKEFFERLRRLLLSADCDNGDTPLPQVHVFDSAGRVRLDPPHPGRRRSSGDWANEIHPNRSGYRKLGRAMGPWLDALLKRYSS